MLEAVSRCSRCDAGVAALWTFCPSCGSTIERSQAPSGMRPAEPDYLSLAALRMVNEGRRDEAEALLREGRETSSGPESRLLYARLLMDRNEIPEARLEFDEALRMAPRSFMVRIRRCEFFTKLGLLLDARHEVEAARLLAPDVASLLHAQDLDRRLTDLSRGTFVRATALPSVPPWLRSLRTRFKKTSAEAVS